MSDFNHPDIIQQDQVGDVKIRLEDWNWASLGHCYCIEIGIMMDDCLVWYPASEKVKGLQNTDDKNIRPTSAAYHMYNEIKEKIKKGEMK